ncbi:MAG: hypothetical protein OXH42_11475 [Acidimicrobiaceae bacterium]|nr:hypothetical protein [Acidimicrobiaceae bacterium]
MSVVLKKIGNGLKSFGHFVAALGHAKNQPSPPDPRKAIRRRLQDATHVAGAGQGGGFTGSADTHASGKKILGQVISDGYQQRR